MTRWTPSALSAKQAAMIAPGRRVNLLGPDDKPDQKPGKHKAVPVLVDGIRFDSGLEAREWQKLKLLEKAGEISDLDRQVTVRCVVNGEHVCDYIADAFYIDCKTFKEVYEDTKSEHTRKLPVYRLKRRLVKACTGIEILET